MKRFRMLLFAACTPGLLAIISSQAAGQQLDDEREPRRVALIIGNESYRTLAPLPSATVDAARMDAKLRDVGFAVQVEKIHSVGDFWTRVLPAFASTIQEGDIAIVHVSGHGFSLGPFNWVAPLDMPASLAETDVSEHAVSLENIASYLEEKSPAVLVVLWDACRSIQSFRLTDASGQMIPTAGLAQGGHYTNVLVGYATQVGSFADGSSNPGEPSAFTRHLLDDIDPPGIEFRTAFSTVTGKMKVRLGKDRAPVLLGASPVQLYLRPTEDVIKKQKELWQAAFASSDPLFGVAVFLELHAASRYAYAARSWLRKQREQELARNFTALSPLAVERSWDTAAAAIRVQPNTLGLAYARSLNASEQRDALRLGDRAIGASSQERASEAPSLREQVASVAAHSAVVTTREFEAYAAPTRASPVRSRLPSGAKLNIIGVERLGANEAWLRAEVASPDSIVYLPIRSGLTALPERRLGKAILEAVVPASPGVPGAIESATLRQVIDSLRAARMQIMWVSLATGQATDTVSAVTGRMMLLHAEHVVKTAGIEGTRVTSVSAAPDMVAAGVRVRIFGWEP